MGVGTGRTGKRCSGFSLVELAIAIVVLVVALGGLSGTVVSTARLARANEQRALADEALRRLAAELHVTPFGDIFAAYNTDPADDPDGPNTGPGGAFDVQGLRPLLDDPDGAVGAIVFPTMVEAGDLQLREDVALPELGMPRDLNGDGVDALDHSDDYLVLPVSLEIEWLGSGGVSRSRMDLILVE